jgi:flagellar basal-body rod protein FlgB
MSMELMGWEGKMLNKLDEMVRFHQTALSLRGARQELLASNIANADTPNFKARDIDFASALQNALAGSSPKLAVTKSSAMHLEGQAGGSILGSPVLYRSPIQPSADGNTVDMDVERAQFTDNALRYEASVKFVSDDLKGLLSAIQG